ncbi:MAG: omega-amidase [Bacteroidales bacterium]|jgi:predicted amidohydrolase|nr:omega-amidase [Bacteroidales bacterium]MDN5329215.1 omega-amidase [Bacteroidales bacterium]
MDKLTVLLVQHDIVWENPEANRQHLTELLKGVSDVDLIVLPEFFNTGFSVNNRDLAENSDGPTVQWMKELAKQTGAVVCGTLPIKEEGKLYNRGFYIGAGGILGFYNKRHLFSPGDEQLLYTPGRENICIHVKSFNIRPQICYDLRFPVWSRNRLTSTGFEYDVLIYHANWPDPRGEVWRQLLIARALENQAYVIGVNRIGSDGQGMTYSAPALAIDYKGRIMAEGKSGVEDLLRVELEWEPLSAFRKKFNVSRDWDDFTLNIEPA